jgi:hypothetical protein
MTVSHILVHRSPYGEARCTYHLHEAVSIILGDDRRGVLIVVAI